MATENKQTWGNRSKKTSVVALGLVAILAGVAVAYFLTTQKYAGNRALGGTLTVDATLPMDFTGQELYPTPTTGTGATSAPSDSNAAATDDFTVTNNNAVKATYQLFATCEECIEDPADTQEQADARAAKRSQFERLYIRIYKPNNTADDIPVIAPGKDDVKYAGRLADLTPDSPAVLGVIDPDGGEANYLVQLWLDNDPNNAQPQGIENIWEFFVSAKTPV